MTAAPYPSASMKPASSGKISAGTRGVGGEEEPIAMLAIVGPFSVDAKVFDRGFDLHDPEFAVRPEPYDVGTAARSEAQFAHHVKAGRTEHPANATLNGEGGIGLARVARRDDRQR